MQVRGAGGAFVQVTLSSFAFRHLVLIQVQCGVDAGLQGQKWRTETTQATVIVPSTDASLKWLWKRASPRRFKTWYQSKMSPSVVPLSPMASLQSHFFPTGDMGFRFELQKEPLETASSHPSMTGEVRRGGQRAHTESTLTSFRVYRQNAYFFVGFLFLQKKKKNTKHNDDKRKKDNFLVLRCTQCNFRHILPAGPSLPPSYTSLWNFQSVGETPAPFLCPALLHPRTPLAAQIKSHHAKDQLGYELARDRRTDCSGSCSVSEISCLLVKV